MQKNRTSFGIGCFHFGYRPHVGTKFTGEDYISQLDKVLTTIPNIEKIVIDADDDFKLHEFEIEQRVGMFLDGPNYFPFPASDIYIRLSLFIPERVQKELGGRLFIQPTCERFVVDINYPYHFPITTVRSVSAPSDFRPSDGVFFCRKFLQQRLERPADTGIFFDSLGPSPFHADIFLEPNESGTGQKFSFERKPSRGYDDCYFRYDPDYFDDIEEVYESLIYDLNDQIGLFYLITHSWVLRERDWSNLYDSILQIIASQKRKGFWVYWKNTLTSEHPLHDAMLSLAQTEVEDLDTRHNLHRKLKELYLGNKPPELLPFLDGAIAEFSSIPFQQMRDILNVLESRRAKRMRLIMMALSAVLGGATGALVALLLK
jgi:hypothetical protein